VQYWKVKPFQIIDALHEWGPGLLTSLLFASTVQTITALDQRRLSIGNSLKKFKTEYELEWIAFSHKVRSQAEGDGNWQMQSDGFDAVDFNSVTTNTDGTNNLH